MTHPQLLRLGEHLQHLKLLRVQERWNLCCKK